MTLIPTNENKRVMKPRYVPIHPKDNGLRENPESSVAQVSAFRAVLIHLLSTAFDLQEEEIAWSGYRLDRALAPLLDQKPNVIPFPVRQEMLNGTYTRLVALRSKKNLVPIPTPINPRVLSATVEEWADAIMAPIEYSYTLRPLDEATMRSEILSLLKELGVGDPVNPRSAIYLPTDLRMKVFADRSKQASA